MFGFVKLIYYSAMIYFGCSWPSVNSYQCISINNQGGKIRPQIVNLNSEEPVFFPFSIKISKCSVVVTISMIHMQSCVFMLL